MKRYIPLLNSLFISFLISAALFLLFCRFLQQGVDTVSVKVLFRIYSTGSEIFFLFCAGILAGGFFWKDGFPGPVRDRSFPREMGKLLLILVGSDVLLAAVFPVILFFMQYPFLGQSIGAVSLFYTPILFPVSLSILLYGFMLGTLISWAVTNPAVSMLIGISSAVFLWLFSGGAGLINQLFPGLSFVKFINPLGWAMISFQENLSVSVPGSGDSVIFIINCIGTALFFSLMVIVLGTIFQKRGISRSGLSSPKNLFPTLIILIPSALLVYLLFLHAGIGGVSVVQAKVRLREQYGYLVPHTLFLSFAIGGLYRAFLRKEDSGKGNGSNMISVVPSPGIVLMWGIHLGLGLLLLNGFNTGFDRMSLFSAAPWSPELFSGIFFGIGASIAAYAAGWSAGTLCSPGLLPVVLLYILWNIFS